jgi:aspartyl/asparaginyl-tRNA synthetase
LTNPGSKLAFVLFRDGLQIIQGVIRAGADSRPTSIASTPLPRSPVRSPNNSVTRVASGAALNDEIEEISVLDHQGVTEEMVRWAEKLPLETLVLVEGRVQSPQEDSQGEQNTVRSANVHGAEIEVTRVRFLPSL